MNWLGIIILTALLIDFVLHAVADALNLSNFKKEVPEPFQDVYTAEQYRQSREYLRANTKSDWVESAFHLILFVGFWFTGGFNLLDQWVRSLSENAVVCGIMFVFILTTARILLGLPFNLYQTFVIEERFGFNKTTWQTFLMDRMKGLMLGIVIGIPLLAAILAFFEYAGANAWWYCWLVVSIFSLLLQFVAPTWIMPLFNKFKPLEAGELRSAILAYAKTIDFPLENVFVMDGSKRSAKSNAFFTGFGRHKRIVLFDTLINQTTVAELVAILAHEMGHFKKRHILMNTAIAICHTGILFFLLSVFISLPALFNAFYMAAPSIYAGMLFFGMLFSPVEFFLGVIMQAFSRYNERQADHFAVTTTRKRQPLISALKKLSVHNLSNLTPHPAYVVLNYSHPPILERIETISKTPESGR